MIKINLIGVAPPPPRAAVGGGPVPAATQVMMLVGALIVCFGSVAIIYKIWKNQISELETKRSQEKIRQSELAVVKAKNDEYQRELKALETRINTIQALQNGRVGPVELMSALGRVVSKTDDLYLYTLAPSGGRLQLKGQAGSVDSMANFLAGLSDSGSFDDVQLEQFYQDDQHERLTYKFTLNCLFKSSTAGTGLEGSGGAGGAATGRGGPEVHEGPQGPTPQTRPLRSM